jgi:hypothetical protein
MTVIAASAARLVVLADSFHQTTVLDAKLARELPRSRFVAFCGILELS